MMRGFGSATLPFVIPSEAEGSAVPPTSNESRWKHYACFRHPESLRLFYRNDKSFLGTRTRAKTKLSSRPKRSEVEGPAVLSITNESRWKTQSRPLSSRAKPRTCPERSRMGICSSLHQQRILIEAPPSPFVNGESP
jgi:hypothetical protein